MSESGASKASKIKSVLSVSHEKDVDGLNSAAIVWRYAKAKNLDYEVILTDYGSFEYVFKKIATKRNTLIIITDLGMDETQLDFIVSSLKKALSNGCRIVWIDHHQWSDRSIKSILSLPNKPILRINHEHCAAEIAFKVLMPRDDVCAELARIAHDTDFNLREIEVASALTDAMSVIRFSAMGQNSDITEELMPILSSLANGGPGELWDETTGKFKDSLLESRVQNYRKERIKKMKKALKGHCDQMIHDRLVRILQMPMGVTTTDIGTFMSRKENLDIDGTRFPVADLLITVSQGGMLGFRRGSERVLCNSAAIIFNGGGHPYAAGGEYGPYDDFQAVCDDIFVILNENKEWVVG